MRGSRLDVLKRFRKQAGGFLAVAVIGVALLHVALGNAVKGHHQPLRAAVFGPVLAHRIGQRGDVARLVEAALVERAHYGCPMGVAPRIH